MKNAMMLLMKLREKQRWHKIQNTIRDNVERNISFEFKSLFDDYKKTGFTSGNKFHRLSVGVGKKNTGYIFCCINLHHVLLWVMKRL